VFIDLARQAGSLPRDVVLSGWLHRHTCYTAAKAVRTEQRRQNREHTAMEMQALDDNSHPEWEQVAPYLDESLNELNPADRDALVLRFLRQQDLRAVGEALGISEDAARKRVDRALEKLHARLKHRGATLSVAALGAALATQAVTAAPAGLAGSVTATALAAALAGTTTAATIATSTTMNWINAKSIAAIVGSALIAATTTYVVQHQANESLRTENAALREQTKRLAEKEEPRVTNELLPAQAKVASSLSESERLELLRLRGQVGVLRQDTAALQGFAGQQASGVAFVVAEAEAKERANETIYALKMMGWANRVYAAAHDDMMPTSFDQLKPILHFEFQPGLNLDQLEFVDHGGAVSQTQPTLALIREHKARQLPDGRWARCYLYVDGGAYLRISDDGNFDRFEKL
jgi:RNA polymerase sigma factor (sigma-70 family)